MCPENKFSVCYLLDDEEYIICSSDENLTISAEIDSSNLKETSIMLSIRNTSPRQVFLKYVTLWQAESKEELQVGDGSILVYRSGRHKNDVPGTFTLGVADERIKDVLGAMSETGDKMESAGTRKLISDHLTTFDVPLDYEILLPNKQVISLQIPKGRREIL